MLLFTFSRTRHAKALAVALVLVVGSVLPVTQAGANGPHVGAREVFSGPAGPYELRVVTAPVVGLMHMTIFVSALGGGEPVTGAAIQVSGRGPEGASRTVGPIRATGSPSGLDWYGASLPIEESGEWMFTVAVDGSLGEEAVEFPVRVRGSGGGTNWFIVGILAVVLTGVVWWAVSWRRSKARRPDRQRRR